MTQRSLLSGAFIITGTVVGAGMLAIPTATAGTWFLPSLMVLSITWLCMMLSGLIILEVSTHYPLHTNFTTIVDDLLGKKWQIINGLTLVFVLYVVTYAYIAIGGDLTQVYVNKGLNKLFPEAQQIPYWLGQTIFFVILALSVILSKSMAARFNMLMVVAMFAIFFLAVAGVLRNVSLETLLDHHPSSETKHYWRYIWVTLPVALTSFGFQSNVPSLRQFFGGDIRKTAVAIIIGSALALFIYILWQLAIQGNLPRHEFGEVIAADGQLSILLKELARYTPTQNIGYLFVIFSYLAIATSFLGVTLGLMDFIADLFNWHQGWSDTVKVALITFMPQYILCVWKPYGFVTVIGYAGMVVAVWAVIVPVFLLIKSRQRFVNDDYRVKVGKAMLMMIFIFGIINIGSHILNQLGALPVFHP